MSKGVATRKAILSEALRQASRIGLEGMSLGPLADSLSLSKSGLFAHFKSKEALQRDVLEEAIERFKRQVVAPGSRPADHGERLRGLFERYLVWIRGASDDGGCIFMTLAQEYDDRPGPIRDRLSTAQRDWRGHLADVVRAGVVAGDFRADADADQAAFELIGAALAFQHSSKLLDDPQAKIRAIAAFDRLLHSLRG